MGVSLFEQNIQKQSFYVEISDKINQNVITPQCVLQLLWTVLQLYDYPYYHLK